MTGDSYSRDQALTDLRKIRDRQGTDAQGFPANISEDDHWQADAILLRVIGDDAIREAFDRVGKWYA